jgi:signal transduction histidine kinase
LKRPHALEKEIELRTELMLDEAIEGMGDHDRLIQVIGNLLGNAIKFTQPGGRVTLRASATDGAVLVEVEDNGPGIDPELLPKLFTPSGQRSITAGLAPAWGSTSAKASLRRMADT